MYRRATISLEDTKRDKLLNHVGKLVLVPLDSYVEATLLGVGEDMVEVEYEERNDEGSVCGSQILQMDIKGVIIIGDGEKRLHKKQLWFEDF